MYHGIHPRALCRVLEDDRSDCPAIKLSIGRKDVIAKMVNVKFVNSTAGGRKCMCDGIGINDVCAELAQMI